MIREFKSESLPIHSSPLRGPSTEVRAQYSRVCLEIGCGVGWHPVQYAKDHPSTLVIAIEHTRVKFDKFQGRKNHHKLDNLMAVHANAVSWVTQELQMASVDHIFILYPNLNVKNRAQRWFCMPFMRRLLKILKPQGTIEVASNSEDYINEVSAQGKSVWNLEQVELKSFGREDQAARTHFEKKYLESGATCWSILLRKSATTNSD